MITLRGSIHVSVLETVQDFMQKPMLKRSTSSLAGISCCNNNGVLIYYMLISFGVRLHFPHAYAFSLKLGIFSSYFCFHIDPTLYSNFDT